MALTIQGRVEKAKWEILVDVAGGRVPVTVKSFSDLHDYVDANEYLAKALEDIPFLMAEDQTKEKDNTRWTCMANAISNEITLWLEKTDLKIWFSNHHVRKRLSRWIDKDVIAGIVVDAMLENNANKVLTLDEAQRIWLCTLQDLPDLVKRQV